MTSARKKDFKFYSMKDLISMETDEHPWIIRNLIPRAGRVLAYGRGGEFKCRAAGQRVLLANGAQVPIETLSGQTVTILSYDEQTRLPAPAVATIFPNGLAVTVELTLASGRKLNLTPNEPLLTAEGWKQAGDIAIGEFLHGIAKTPSFCLTRLPEGHAYFLGAMVGDGCCKSKTAQFSCADPEMLHAFESACHINSWVVRPNGPPNYRIQHEAARKGTRVPGNPREVLDMHGLLGKSSASKRVPPALFSGDIRDVADFLGGYWDADGTWDWNGVKRWAAFASINRELLSDVQLLLLRLGCKSSLRGFSTKYKEAPYMFYRLELFGRSAVEFIFSASLHSSKGNRARELCLALPDTNYEPADNRIPAAAVKAILGPIGSKFFYRRVYCTFEYGRYQTWNRAKVGIFAAYLGMLAEMPRDEWPRTHSPVRLMTAKDLHERATALNELVDESIWWDRIVDINPMVELLPTWGLTCPEHGTYICEGIISHNSSLAFDLAVAVSSAGRMMEQIEVETYGPVLLISTEGTIYSTRNRILGHLRARNLHPSVVSLTYERQAICLNEAADREVFEDALERLRPVMVVLDPYASCYSGDEDNTREVKAFVAILDDYIERHKCTIVLIHHANKLGEMRGSTVIQGWADAVLKFTVARKANIPGLVGKHDILTVTAEKQRDGPSGKALSAVPIFNEALKMITFGVFQGMDAKMVKAVYFKHELLQYLRGLSEPMTRGQLMDQLHIGQELMDTALRQLENDRLAEQVEARRSTGGARSRPVEAWQACAISKVDAACAILRAEKRAEYGPDDE